MHKNCKQKRKLNIPKDWISKTLCFLCTGKYRNKTHVHHRPLSWWRYHIKQTAKRQINKKKKILFHPNLHSHQPNKVLPEATINLNGKKSYDFDIQANQLSDILCRGATVSSVQSTNNTLTRNSTLRDTGDYDVPHPHPYTHHYMTTSTSATPQAMSIVGSSPQGSFLDILQIVLLVCVICSCCCYRCGCWLNHNMDQNPKTAQTKYTPNNRRKFLYFLFTWNDNVEKLIIFWQEQTVLEMTIGYKALAREFVSLKKSWVFRKQWQPTIRTNKITTICLTQHQDRHRVRDRVPALALAVAALLVWTAWCVQDEEAIAKICQLIIWKRACITNDRYQLYRHRHKCIQRMKLSQLMLQVLYLYNKYTYYI